MPAWRSLLFVAADDAVRLAKVADRGADAVILDLEDAVPPGRKQAAREGLAPIIDTLARKNCPLVVRVNSGWMETVADLSAAVRPGVAAIMVPKVEGASRLLAIGEMISEWAVAAGMTTIPGMIALVESPAGLNELDAVARVPGVIGLALGTEDFSLVLGVAPSREALDFPCRLLALAAARHGRMALGLPVSIATMADHAAWRAGVQTARAIGMTGALCIHPAQVSIANEGFAPTAEEVASARATIEAWSANESAGVIQVAGKMIDLPVARAAERTLSRINKR